MIESLTRRLSCLASLALIACASPDARQGAGPADAGEAVAADAVGLPRERPGEIVIDQGDDTVATPYGGAGAARTCPSLARDIARITAVVGPDQAPREDETAEDRSADGDAMEFASDIAEDAPDLVRDAARDAIVGLNPARPVVRFLGRAGEIEAEARRERQLAMNRRAWLRGAFDTMGCEHATLVEAYRAYNLLEDADAE